MQRSRTERNAMLEKGRGGEGSRAMQQRKTAAPWLLLQCARRTFGMTSMVVVRMDSSCIAVGRYTRCLAGFSCGPLLAPAGGGHGRGA